MKKFKHLFLISILFSIIWSGCSKDFSPFKILHNTNRTEEWISMGPDSVHFYRIRIYGDYLYGLSVNQGLYRIKKYKTNDWQFLGLGGLKGKYTFGLSDFVVLKNTIIAAATDHMYRSTDNGMTWDTTSFNGYCFTFGQSPHDKRIVIVGNEVGQMFITKDFGRTWETCFDVYGLSGTYLDFQDIEFNPNNPNEIWAGARAWYPNAFVTRSIDGGMNWNTIIEVNESPEGKDYMDWIFSIAFSPDKDSTVYLGMRRVWKTTDNCKTFTEFFNVFPDSTPQYDINGFYYSIDINPDDSEEIFISESNKGIFHTFDKGKTWTNYTLSEGKSGYFYLATDWENRILFVLVGRHIYRLYF